MNMSDKGVVVGVVLPQVDDNDRQNHNDNETKHSGDDGDCCTDCCLSSVRPCMHANNKVYIPLDQLVANLLRTCHEHVFNKKSSYANR